MQSSDLLALNLLVTDDAGEVFGIGALDTPPKTPKVPSAGTRKRLVLSPPELAGDKKNKVCDN